MSWDIFLSHASEDKDDVVGPLARALVDRGWTVWYDEFELAVGDSLNRKISEGLRQCDFGVVILSPAFFEKEWPQRELDGLATRETGEGTKVLLPVWHQLGAPDVTRYSPMLGDRFAVRTSEGMETVANKLSEAIRRTRSPENHVQRYEDEAEGRGGPEDLLAPALRIRATDRQDPVAGFELAADEVEIAIRDLTSASGHEDSETAPVEKLLDGLVERGQVASGPASNYTTLVPHIRERLATGADDVAQAELRGVTDALVSLLQIMLVSPPFGYEVAVPGVPVYRDPDCTRRFDDVVGVVLWELGSQRQHRAHRIYPTRRTYEQGQLLGWQWSFEAGWGDAWWDDVIADDGKKLAWSASAEFVGKPLVRQLRMG